MNVQLRHLAYIKKTQLTVFKSLAFGIKANLELQFGIRNTFNYKLQK